MLFEVIRKALLMKSLGLTKWLLRFRKKDGIIRIAKILFLLKAYE